MSTLHETTYRGTLAKLKRQLEPETKGEIVIVVGPAQRAGEPPDFAAKTLELAAEGLTGSALRAA